MTSESDDPEFLKSRIRDLEAVLGQRSDLASKLHLPHGLGRLLGLLMAVPYASTETIRHRLGISSDPKVAIHRLRRLLKPRDIEVRSRRTHGYWLPDEAKQKIRGLLEPTQH